MTANSAFGTLLCSGSTSGSSGAIAGVKSINGVSLSLDTQDVTTMNSTGGYEEVIPTIIRTGEVELELVYDPAAATHTSASAGGLVYDLVHKTLSYYHIYIPVGSGYNWVFQAYVTGFEPKFAVDGAMEATATLKVTGAVSFS